MIPDTLFSRKLYPVPGSLLQVAHVARHKDGVLSYDSDVLIDQLFADAKQRLGSTNTRPDGQRVCHVLTVLFVARHPLLLMLPRQ